MINSTSIMRPGALPSLNHVKNEENDISEIASMRLDNINIFPVEVWEKIINMYAEEKDVNINSLINVMLVCWGLNYVCNTLRKLNTVFGQKINIAQSHSWWKKLDKICQNKNISNDQFFDQINKDLGGGSHVKIIFPCILDSKRQLIVLEHFLSRINVKYLELIASNLNIGNPNSFFDDFVGLLNKNEDLKFFGALDFGFRIINSSHIENLLLLLAGRSFKKIIFSSAAINEEIKEGLSQLFILSTVSDEFTQITLKDKTKVIGNTIEWIEDEDKKNIEDARNERQRRRDEELARLTDGLMGRENGPTEPAMDELRRRANEASRRMEELRRQENERNRRIDEAAHRVLLDKFTRLMEANQHKQDAVLNRPARDPVKEASDRQLAQFNSQMEANQRKQDAVFNRPARNPVKEASDRQFAQFNSQMEANRRKQDAVFNRPARDPIKEAADRQLAQFNSRMEANQRKQDAVFNRLTKQSFGAEPD